MTSRLNHRSPAVKRILQEMKEMRELMDSSPDTPFAAEPLESDIFHWQFVIKGEAEALTTHDELPISQGRVAHCGLGHSVHALQWSLRIVSHPVLPAGAPSTEFENGIYHGRIILPPDYPFKAPSFIMLTPVRIQSVSAADMQIMYIS